MKRSTAQWVVTVMAAAVMAAPAAAQTTPPTQPPATAQPTTPPQAQAGSAEEHLKAATAALNDVQAANLSARAKTQVNELKRRVTALERLGTAAPSASAKAPASRVNWGTEVAAMDKILTSLLGAEAAATGTTGTTTRPTGTAGKAAAAVTLDDASRAKLTEVRTHLTAYAAAMAGAPKSDAPATTDPTPTAPTGSSSTSTPLPGSTATSTPTTPPPAPATPAAPPAQTAPAAQPDMDVAKKHLTEARNSLSALTQLPAAGQLAGEARTQVSQLITNFNELITTQSNWRDVYSKVDANMTALLGSETAAVAAATGTAGAVGTSGTSAITLDPTVREKLVEMRKHLAEFEKAAGGGTTTSTAANVEDPPTAPPATSTSTATTTGATGTPATSAATTGTSGTTPPATSSADAQRTGAQADWMKHVTAIEAMLKSQDESGGLTLDKAKVEMLRTHLAEIKKLLERK